MADRISAGLLMYRIQPRLEFFLAHPGGPFFRKKDEGHWSIPKGEVETGEALLDAAIREFSEEVGLKPQGEFLPLGSIVQKGGKIVHAWAFEGDWPEGKAPTCNHCQIEWPPGTGKTVSFPEIDQVDFFDVETAKRKLKATQHPFLERLAELLKERQSS